jgi:hypothetical protein
MNNGEKLETKNFWQITIKIGDEQWRKIGDKKL